MISGSKEKNFLWFRVGKCASSSIKAYLDENVDDFRLLIRNQSNSTIPLKNPKKTISYYDSATSFSFVRNPWDRLVSCWSEKIDQKKNPQSITETARRMRNRHYSFEKFIKSITRNPAMLTQMDRHWQPYWSQFQRFGKVPDYIGKVENLQEDFDTICGILDIPDKGLPHRNSSKHKHYTEYYTDELRDLVAKAYARDIDDFEYEFGK